MSTISCKKCGFILEWTQFMKKIYERSVRELEESPNYWLNPYYM